MTDFNYKNYSLEKLEEWVHDALSCSDASPHEIYSVVRKVVQDEYNYHKEQSQKCLGLLELLSGHRPVSFDDLENQDKILSCDKNDPSPECKGAWNSFWEDSMPPWGHSDLEYCIREAEYYQKKDKVVKWQLPVEVDGLTGDCLISLPDDLLEMANLKEGDTVEWIDNKDGSFAFKKCEPEKTKGLPTHQELIKNGYKTYEEAVKDGWTMTADGFWIKEN